MQRNAYSPNSVSGLPLFDRPRVNSTGSGAALAGAHYDPAKDRARLVTQMERVRVAMKGMGWITLAKVAARAECGEASASAQMRNLRKLGHTIETRRAKGGLFEYRLVVDEQRPDDGDAA